VKLASTIDLDSNPSISGTITYSTPAEQITGTLVASDTFTIDGVTLGAVDNGTRLILKDQTSDIQNGIWTTTISGTSLTLDRSSDFDTAAEINGGESFFVEDGTVNKNATFVQTLNVTTLGTDSIQFIKFGVSTDVTAGSGITVTGSNTVNVDVSGSSTVGVSGNSLIVTSSAFAGQVLVSLGTVTTEALWGSVSLSGGGVTGTLPVSRGGTGFSTYTANSLLFASSAFALSELTPGPDEFLISNAVGVPTFSSTLPTGLTVTNWTLTTPTLDCPTVENNLKLEETGAGTNLVTIEASVQSGDVTVTIPDMVGAGQDFVFVDLAQTLTNKTLDTGTTINMPTITDPIIEETISLKNSGGAGTIVFQKTSSADSGTAQIPTLGGATDDFVMRTLTQTVTSKTITSSIINDATNTVGADTLRFDVTDDITVTGSGLSSGQIVPGQTLTLNAGSTDASFKTSEQLIKGMSSIVGAPLTFIVKAASTTDLSALGGFTYTGATITWTNDPPVDGFSLIDGDYVLVRSQTSTDENGIYERTSNLLWSRLASFATATRGTFIYVETGLTLAGCAFILTATPTSIPGSPVIFGAATTTLQTVYNNSVGNSTIQLEKSGGSVSGIELINDSAPGSTDTVFKVTDSASTFPYLEILGNGEEFRVQAGNSIGPTVDGFVDISAHTSGTAAPTIASVAGKIGISAVDEIELNAIDKVVVSNGELEAINSSNLVAADRLIFDANYLISNNTPASQNVVYFNSSTEVDRFSNPGTTSFLKYNTVTSSLEWSALEPAVVTAFTPPTTLTINYADGGTLPPDINPSIDPVYNDDIHRLATKINLILTEIGKINTAITDIIDRLNVTSGHGLIAG